MAAEILCKISAPSKGARLGRTLGAHLSYLDREGTGVNPRTGEVTNRAKLVRASDGKVFDKEDYRELRREVRNGEYYYSSLILSFRGNDLDSEQQDAIAQRFCRELMERRPGMSEVYYCRHENTDHQHYHLVALSRWREDVRYSVQRDGRDLNALARETYESETGRSAWSEAEAAPHQEQSQEWRDRAEAAVGAAADVAGAVSVAEGESTTSRGGGRIDDEDRRRRLPARRRRHEEVMER